MLGKLSQHRSEIALSVLLRGVASLVGNRRSTVVSEAPYQVFCLQHGITTLLREAPSFALIHRGHGSVIDHEEYARDRPTH